MKMTREGSAFSWHFHCTRYPQRLRTGLRSELGMAQLQHRALNCA